MKIKLFSSLIALIITVSALAQKNASSVEVLYFKAQLSCCQARACDALESDVKKIIDNNFKNKNVKFKEIKLNEPANNDIVKKYNAKSQIVILVSTKKGKITTTDVSDVVSEYVKNNDFNSFQKKVTDKINQLL
jgi:hypothetical protein